MRHVCQMRAVGRERGFLANGDGQLRGKAALYGDGVELVLEVTEAATPGREQNILAVGGPTKNVFICGMEGQPPRHASSGRNHVHIAVPVILAGEGNHGAVGRETGDDLRPHAGREGPRVAALTANDPEITAVIE